MKRHNGRILSVTGLVFAGVGLAGCASDSAPVETESSSPTAAPSAPSEGGAVTESALNVDAATVVVEFEASADPVSREISFRMLNEQLILPQIDASESDDIRSVRQASFCSVPVDRNGVAGTGPASTVEIYSEPGTTLLDTECGSQAYYALGAFCSDITVRSFYATATLNDVYAQITEISNRDLFIGFAFPLGTGAPPVAGLSNELGLWAYDDLGPADGHVGAPFGSPPDENTVQWVFQLLGDDNFTFRGRVVARYSELCTAPGGVPTDDDCDGRIDEGASCYPDGELCVDASDCQTGICSAGRCGVSDFLSERVMGTAGGGTASGPLNTVEIRIGAPAPIGATGDANYQLQLGPLSDR